MEVPAKVDVSTLFSFKFYKPPAQIPTANFRTPNSLYKKDPFKLSSSSSAYCTSSHNRTCATSSLTAETPSIRLSSSSSVSNNRHWMVLMEGPPQGISSKQDIIDYYVKNLGTVLGSERDAQMCIYDASWDTHFGFCCDIDEETSSELACLPEVISVRPDPDFNSVEKDYSASNVQTGDLLNPKNGSTLLFPSGNTKHWLVRMDNPYIGVVSKAQMVDYYVQMLAKVFGNEKDAQMCIYHISWQSNFGFCCELDNKCANELAGVPGVLTVQPDENIESEIKDYGGEIVKNSVDQSSSSEAIQTTPIKTKKLFVTGLSFYTSEKTLRAAFEGFGELVEVKIIMDKISKRSKGYAFVEYTTEEAASAALKEMNGKIINGWMIVVDVAKTSSPRSGRGQPRQSV